MKAKEYAQILKGGNYDTDSVSKVIQGLLGEITSLFEARHIATISGLNGVVQEIRQKWRAVCRRAEGLNIDGFDKFLKDKNIIDDKCNVTDILLREKYGFKKD